MALFNNVLDAIGNTPLIRLNRIAAGLPIELYGKFEALNPGGSIKDRIGLAMIEAAERDGRRGPGGTIVEATAGNTGVGLALAAAIKGYRCIFTVPTKMSEEKVRLLESFGAEVVMTPNDVPPDSVESYNGAADRLAGEIPGSFRPSQFANDENPAIHYRTTGPEIWRDTKGRIDVFVAGAGTGGTISGAGKYLKEKKPEVSVVLADPEGSILSGDQPHSFLVEGIGEDFIPYTFNRQVVDDFVRVSDCESFTVARRLAREEGLLVGSSSGTAVAAALRYAERLKNGEVVVVVLPDTGRNYMSKLFDEDWLLSKDLLSDSSHRFTAGDAVQLKNSPGIISVKPTATLAQSIAVMHQHNISQLPIMDDGKAVGSVNETALMQLIHKGTSMDTDVQSIMGRPFPTVLESTDIQEVYRLLLGPNPAVIVEVDGKAASLLTALDLVDCLSKRSEK
jgi:cystathionine beta-synthase